MHWVGPCLCFLSWLGCAPPPSTHTYLPTARRAMCVKRNTSRKSKMVCPASVKSVEGSRRNSVSGDLGVEKISARQPAAANLSESQLKGRERSGGPGRVRLLPSTWATPGACPWSRRRRPCRHSYEEFTRLAETRLAQHSLNYINIT